MTASTSKRTGGGADSHCTEDARCAPASCSLVAATPIRPRVFIVTDDDEMGDLMQQALESKYDVNRHSSLGDPLDDLLGDVDVAILDSTSLGRIAPTTTADDRERAACEELPISLDLKAVHQLGTMVKGLSARWRGRRRTIN